MKVTVAEKGERERERGGNRQTNRQSILLILASKKNGGGRRWREEPERLKRNLRGMR